MSDRSTLGLLDLIAEQTELPGASVPLVLPTIHDSALAEEGLLAAFAQYHEGAYFDVSRPVTDCRGPIDAARLSVAQALFRRASLEFEASEHGGAVQASFSGHPEPSGGLETALRVAQLFVSSEIDLPVVFLVYPQAGMDPGVAAAVWDLVGLAISDAAPPRLKTWVPIAVGDVDVRRHCNLGNSVRFAVQRDRLITRGVATDLAAAISSLLLSRDQPLVLFLGAGAAASAGISLGDSVRTQALRQVTGQQGGLETLTDAFHEWLGVNGRWRENESGLTRSQFAEQLTLERVLREEFHQLAGLGKGMSRTVATLTGECEAALQRNPQGRQALRALAAELPRLLIGTVNFDRLVEDGLETKHFVVSTPDEFLERRKAIVDRLEGRGEDLPILKLHGTIEKPDSLVADIERTDIGLPDEIAATLDAMIAASGSDPLTWVWIGCSMRDVDLKAWLKRKNGATQLREWWVDPLPSQSLFGYAEHVRASQWATLEHTLRNRLVTETADTFLPALLEHAKSLPKTI